MTTYMEYFEEMKKMLATYDRLVNQLPPVEIEKFKEVRLAYNKLYPHVEQY